MSDALRTAAEISDHRSRIRGRCSNPVRGRTVVRWSLSR